jgi:hypothetical protein
MNAKPLEARSVRSRIERDAAEIVRLHARIGETFRDRDRNAAGCAAWEQACQEFRGRYNDLAFPGGYDRALREIEHGQAHAVESALCFLELRPYFFRSGYMYKVILRKLKKASLPPNQKARLDAIVAALQTWRAAKHTSRDQSHY